MKLRSLSTYFIFAISSTSWLSAQSKLEIPLSAFGDEIVRHSAYTLGYSEQHEQARWVAYELTSAELDGHAKRKDDFRSDPSVSTGSASLVDYRGSGYDRGHLAPAADMKLSSTYMSESFFMSNMSPQLPGFNRGIWKNLEAVVRKMSIANQSIHIVTGPILSSNKGSIGTNQVTIPRFYYKVILDYTAPEFKAIGFIIANEASNQPLSSYATTVDRIEERTGLDFFSGLPDDLETLLEGRYLYEEWNVKDISSLRTAGKTCAGMTKAGNKCMRAVKAAGTYCYQHKPSSSSSTVKKANRSISKSRCQASTQNGTQCKRSAQVDNRFCWQHQ